MSVVDSRPRIWRERTPGPILTIKSRPLTDGRVSWFLYVRRPRPERDELIPVKGHSRPEDRAAVEAYAKPFREALATAPPPETCDEWFDRYDAYQRKCGQTDPTKRTRWNKWISPRIGKKTPDAVTRADVEDTRDALDAAVVAWKLEGASDGRIAGKTAMNVWSALTSSFKAMVSSKRRDLRVLNGKPNPCAGVEPPGDRNSREARQKPFVYPKEADAVFACEAIALERRELYAIAAYTYLRPGELRVLTKADVDLNVGLIHVTKAWDYAEEMVKPPKTLNGVRRVPIAPALVPLLRRMLEGKADTDLVVPILSRTETVTSNNRKATVDHLAVLFRDHLKLAGVGRAELHSSTKTHVQSNFRSWRDSGLTWLAMTGLGVDKIMRRAGHDMVQTTMGYVKQAEDLTGDLGTPFGRLPASLIGEDHAPSDGAPAPCERPVNGEPSPSASNENGTAFQRCLGAGEGIRTLDVHLGKRPGYVELLAFSRDRRWNLPPPGAWRSYAAPPGGCEKGCDRRLSLGPEQSGPWGAFVVCADHDSLMAARGADAETLLRVVQAPYEPRVARDGPRPGRMPAQRSRGACTTRVCVDHRPSSNSAQRSSRGGRP
ncbi:MAG: tyrosine-type recombinase/integrase [Labilithrix sp.]|nr:tyrosine-type recombinase/integrase [Labilithrix sp.]